MPYHAYQKAGVQTFIYKNCVAREQRPKNVKAGRSPQSVPEQIWSDLSESGAAPMILEHSMVVAARDNWCVAILLQQALLHLQLQGSLKD